MYLIYILVGLLEFLKEGLIETATIVEFDYEFLFVGVVLAFVAVHKIEVPESTGISIFVFLMVIVFGIITEGFNTLTCKGGDIFEKTAQETGH